MSRKRIVVISGTTARKRDKELRTTPYIVETTFMDNSSVVLLIIYLPLLGYCSRNGTSVF